MRYVATYFVNGIDRNAKDERLVSHHTGCRFLQPSEARPHVGARPLAKGEKRRKCQFC